MFVNIAIQIEIPKIPLDKYLVQHSGSHDKAKFLHTDKLIDENIVGIKLYSCGQEFDSNILNQLPKDLLDIEVPYVYVMDVEKENNKAVYLPPHIDRGRRCALNFYTECNEETTEFYTNNGELLGGFIATNGSAWLLDVSKPHSVMFNKGNKRSGITLSFRHKNYAQVVSALKGYIYVSD